MLRQPARGCEELVVSGRALANDHHAGATEEQAVALAGVTERDRLARVDERPRSSGSNPAPTARIAPCTGIRYTRS